MRSQSQPGDVETAAPSMTADAADEGSVIVSSAGQRIGPYQIVRTLGSGGMGSVYLARRVDGQFEQEVAVKVVKRGAHTELVLERFHAERQILAALQHPNICRLLDGGSGPDGLPYFVMERIDGEPIDGYCKWHRPPLRRRLELFLAICDAVKYAHQRLVVHCDLKPRNILVTGEGVPKLVDFGIAKLLEQPSEGGTHSGFMTPAYASPEQVRGERITTATDVHALGIVLYELLAGAHPFGGSGVGPADLQRAILEEEPVPPSLAIGSARLGRPLRGDLDTIVLRALSKDPARRYASAGDLAADVERHLAGQPVLARRDSLRYRAGKFVRRHRLGVAAAVTLFVSLVGGITATAWQAGVAERQRARAERHYAAVRLTANALVFDVHDAIVDLQGSTAARKLVVAHALRLYDGLAGDAHGDPGLQRELAETYRKLGDVQGRPGMPNLGDFAGARASYDKGLTLAEELVARDPGDLAARHQRGLLLRVIGRNLWRAHDLEGALAYARRALDDENVVLAARPGDLDAGLLAANLDIDIADYLVDLGRGGQAVSTYRRSLARYVALAEGTSEPRARRGIPFALHKIGDASLDAGDPRGALVEYLGSLVLDEASVARAPDDVYAQRQLALSQAKVGKALRSAGDAGAALPRFLRALKTYRNLLAADPLDARGRRDLAVGLTHVGRTYHDVAVGLAPTSPDGARAAYDQAAAVLREALVLYAEITAKGELRERDKDDAHDIEKDLVTYAEESGRLAR